MTSRSDVAWSACRSQRVLRVGLGIFGVCRMLGVVVLGTSWMAMSLIVVWLVLSVVFMAVIAVAVCVARPCRQRYSFVAAARRVHVSCGEFVVVVFRL